MGRRSRHQVLARDGHVSHSDDGQEVSPDLEFVALCGETLIGWVRFNGKGELPDRIMGEVFDNFVLPARNSLGDTDRSAWRIDPWGQPGGPVANPRVPDPAAHRHVGNVHLSRRRTPPGAYAVGQLGKHYGRCCKDHGEVPLVHLRAGTTRAGPSRCSSCAVSGSSTPTRRARHRPIRCRQ